jgi:tRNA(adenine34) deaminase
VDFQPDEQFMRQALVEAHHALEAGETPVGAVAVREGRIVARDHNRVEALTDATAHAEILVLGAAASEKEDWRLDDLTLYVTMEPCPMCAGAILLSRVARLVYGVRDQRAGACGTRLDLLQANPFGHEMQLRDGCLEGECLAPLQDFYQSLRRKSAKPS